MPLSTPELRARFVTRVLAAVRSKDFGVADAAIESVLRKMAAQKKERGRIPSTAAMHETASVLVRAFRNENIPLFETAADLYRAAPRLLSRMFAFGMLTAVPTREYSKVLPFVERSAASDDPDERDFMRRSFRHSMKKFPGETKIFLRKIVRSRNPRVRQFAAEILRPVGDNVWLFKNPCYCMTVLRVLFREKDPDARNAVADTIAAFAKDRPDRVADVLKHLKGLKDPNADRIVIAVCRDFIKTDPVETLNILGVPEYRSGGKNYSLTDTGLKHRKFRRKNNAAGTC